MDYKIFLTSLCWFLFEIHLCFVWTRSKFALKILMIDNDWVVSVQCAMQVRFLIPNNRHIGYNCQGASSFALCRFHGNAAETLGIFQFNLLHS